MIVLNKIKTYKTLAGAEIVVEEHICDKCNAKYISAFKLINRENSYLVPKSFDNDCKCKICENHNYDKADLLEDKKYLDKLLSGQGRLQLKPDNTHTKFWTKIYEIGKNEQNRFGNYQFMASKVALSCKNCGAIKIESIADTDDFDNIVCNTCRAALLYKYIGLYNSNLNKINRLLNEQKAIDTLEIDKMQQEKQEEAGRVIKMKKKNFNMTQISKRFKEYNPTQSLIDAYIKDGIEKSIITCDICGTISEENTLRLSELKSGISCPGCLARKDNPNYSGILKRNLVNTTKNGLVCTKDNGKTVILKCACCGENFPDTDKIQFLLGKITCKKKKDRCSTVELICSNRRCNKPITVHAKEIEKAQKDGGIYCPDCKTNILHDVIIENQLEDHRIEVRKALNDLSEKVRGEVGLKNSMAKAVKPLYVDNDNLRYYNCRCTEHNQSCILNDAELESNMHMFCNNIRNVFLDMAKISNLKISREASFKEKMDKKEDKNNINTEE